ncbi:MAG: molybdopterin-dependent oxidoreductase, partial [Chromatiales bacterium]|nr:molybdopterin-dependent oxidoreductase [Chromatiales bacterium]
MKSRSLITNAVLAARADLDEGASVGLALAHDSAVRHVRGTAAYIDDLPEPAGTVHVAPGCAGEARGAIRSIDLDAVRAFPGVLAVLTAADIPGANDCSPAFGDDPILAAGEILFHGQVVFAVVAETRDAARRAARRARIEVDSVAPRVTVDEGLAAGAEVLSPYEFRRGEPAAAIAAASRRLEGWVRIGGQEHFYLEGQAALAVPGEDDEMRVWSSTQHPSEVQNLVAHMLGVPGAAVVCECRRMGGAFGGKESQAAQWACLAALAARVTGRPAKVRLDRDDDMTMTGKRHDFRVDWRCGFDGEGVLEGVDVELAGRCGYSADLSLGVNDRAMFHADNAYYYPAARIHSRRVRTDTVSNTAFRGFGGPQGTLFAERMMDAVAITLELDPLVVRKRNLYAPGRDVTPYGMRVDDHVVNRIVRRLERTSGYAARRRAIARFNARAARAGNAATLRKGIALTPVKFGIAFTL